MLFTTAAMTPSIATGVVASLFGLCRTRAGLRGRPAARLGFHFSRVDPTSNELLQAERIEQISPLFQALASHTPSKASGNPHWNTAPAAQENKKPVPVGNGKCRMANVRGI